MSALVAVAPEPAAGAVLYADRWLKVDTAHAYRADGTPFAHRRVQLGPGPGAVIICLAGTKVAMVRQPRPAAGIASSLELVQGGTTDDSAGQALGNLLAETGLPEGAISSFERLGTLYPDPSMVRNQVTVWLARSAESPLTQVPDWGCCGVPEWIELDAVIASDEVVSGLTMASLHLFARQQATERQRTRRQPSDSKRAMPKREGWTK